MTVKELIEELQRHKQNLPVIIECNGERKDKIKITDEIKVNGKGFIISLIIEGN